MLFRSFDGSLVDGKVVPLRATGFGIAIIAENGDLLAIARGAPPRWCTTAAAAEAWALLEVLRLSAFAPKVRTDCLALLTTARQGTAIATGPGRPLARIWRAIAEILDGDIIALAKNDVLVWQPAHQTAHAIGERICFDGRRLSTIDWRANRLADALAKQAAAAGRACGATVSLVASARVAALHAACNLGQVTYASNNHRVAQTDADGKEVFVTKRDAEPAPKRLKRPRADAGERPAPAAASSSNAGVHPWTPAAPCSRPAKRPGTARTRAREDEAATLQHCLGELGARLGTSSGREPAAVRFEQVRRRVQQRLGLSLP